MIYEIADRRIELKNRYEYTTRFCKEYESADQSSPVDFVVSLTDEELSFEREHSKGYDMDYVENLALYRKLCIAFTADDRFLFHGTVLTYEGKGYLFTGRSGSGKTTHTSLWRKYVPSSAILNGDKPIIAMEGDKLIAYGTPWNGKEGIGYNGKAELCAICFIKQAKENNLEKKENAVTELMGQLLIPKTRKGVEQTLIFADKLAHLPVYELNCTISKEAVIASYEGMTGKRYED